MTGAAKLTCLDFSLHGMGGQDRHAQAAQYRLLDRLVAAQFQRHPQVGAPGELIAACA